MPKFDIRSFLETAAQVGAGSIAGKLQGQQMLQEQQQQQMTQVMQLALFKQRQEEQTQQAASRKREEIFKTVELLSKVGAKPEDLAGYFAAGLEGKKYQPPAGTPGAQPAPFELTPEQQQRFGGVSPTLPAGLAPTPPLPAPTAPPAEAEKPLPTIEFPYGKVRFAPKVDPKEIASIRQGIVDIRKEKTKWPSATTEDELRIERTLDAELSIPLDTPENVDRARQALSNYYQYARSKNIAREQLTETERVHEGQSIETSRKELGSLSPLAAVSAITQLYDQAQEHIATHGKKSRVIDVYKTSKDDIEEMRRLAATGNPDDLVKAEQLAATLKGRLSAGVSPKDEASRVKAFYFALGKASSVQARDPIFIKAQAAAAGLGEWISNFTDDQLKGFMGAQGEKTYLDLLKDAPNQAKLSPADQILFLGALRRAAEAAGIKAEIPGKLVLQLSDEAKARVAQGWAHVDIARGNLGARTAYMALEVWKAKHSYTQESAKARGLTYNSYALGLRRDWELAFQKYSNALKTEGISEIGFDPKNPAPGTPPGLIRLYNDVETKRKIFMDRIEATKPEKFNSLPGPPDPVAAVPDMPDMSGMSNIPGSQPTPEETAIRSGGPPILPQVGPVGFPKTSKQPVKAGASSVRYSLTYKGKQRTNIDMDRLRAQLKAQGLPDAEIDRRLGIKGR